MNIIKQLYSPDCPIVVELGCPASSIFPRKETRMKQNNSEAVVYADSVEVQESSTAEIDLYTELASFELLTPEEQASLAVHSAISTEENPPEDESAESPEYGSDLGRAPFGFVEAVVAEQASVSDGVEDPALGDSQAAYSEI